jgi:hypothetical protein
MLSARRLQEIAFVPRDARPVSKNAEQRWS